VKEFIIAAKEQTEGEPETLEFKVDGTVLVCYPPSEGQLVLIMAAMSGVYNTEGEQAAIIINFLISLLNEDGSRYVQRRLMDRKDEFGFENVMQILEYIVEEWTANPTKLLSGSTSSPDSIGGKSTENVRVKAPTRSRSARAVSAT
jgi:hypothetical protein